MNMEFQRNVTRAQLEFGNATAYSELVDRNFLEALFNGTNLKDVNNYVQAYKMLKDETFITSFRSFLTFHRGYLNEVFERFILESHQHGIIDYWYRHFFRYDNIEKQIATEPKVLTMYMLSSGFYIWLGSIGIACFVFICEHVKYFIEERYTYKM